MKLGWWWWWTWWDFGWEECEVWDEGDGEEATGEGGQNDCRPGWELEVERDWEDGEEEGVMLPLLLMPLALAPLLASPCGAPRVPDIPKGPAKPFWWGGSRGEAVGGGRCFGGDGEGCEWCFPLPTITKLGL